MTAFIPLSCWPTIRLREIRKGARLPDLKTPYYCPAFEEILSPGLNTSKTLVEAPELSSTPLTISSYSNSTWIKSHYFWLQQELKESQSPFVLPFVRSVQICLELSIFIFLAQIFKLTSYELQSVSQQSISRSAVSQQSFNSHSVSHHTVGALNTSSCCFVPPFIRK